jgi:Zn-dependent alcohol dehydrogenase
MPTTATAIVTDGRGHFELTQVQLGDPYPGEVLVEIKASGVCHTDFDSLSWKRRMIVGHEGAGIVVACGEGVTNVTPGDRVLLNWAIPCGSCFQCRRWRGEHLRGKADGSGRAFSVRQSDLERFFQSRHHGHSRHRALAGCGSNRRGDSFSLCRNSRMRCHDRIQVSG